MPKKEDVYSKLSEIRGDKVSRTDGIEQGTVHEHDSNSEGITIEEDANEAAREFAEREAQNINRPTFRTSKAQTPDQTRTSAQTRVPIPTGSVFEDAIDSIETLFAEIENEYITVLMRNLVAKFEFLDVATDGVIEERYVEAINSTIKNIEGYFKIYVPLVTKMDEEDDYVKAYTEKLAKILKDIDLYIGALIQKINDDAIKELESTVTTWSAIIDEKQENVVMETEVKIEESEIEEVEIETVVMETEIEEVDIDIDE